MPEKYHIWPYSGKRHPVGEKHDKTDMKKGEYRDGRGTYKEGKWEFIKLKG